MENEINQNIESVIYDFGMDDLPNEVLKHIYQYWLDLKASRCMPSYQDINFSEIQTLKPYLALVETKDKMGRYKVRMAGSEFIKVMGFDITGKYLDEYPIVQENLKGRIEWLVSEKKPYLYFNKLKWTEKIYFDYYALGLPLSENNKDVNMVMYGLYYQLPKNILNKLMS